MKKPHAWQGNGATLGAIEMNFNSSGSQRPSEPVSGSYTIKLKAIRRQQEFFLAVAEDHEGRHAWSIPCTALDLQTFDAFQGKFAAYVSVWVDHPSQREATRLERADAWQKAIAEAFNAGARGGNPE